MRSESVPRIGRGWYAAAVLSAVVALCMGVLGWRQLNQADRIAADPVKVQGTVTRLPGGSVTYSEVSYRAAGRAERASDLRLPEGVALGDEICLEYASADPATARVCGQRYPQAAGIGLAWTSIPLGLAVLLVCGVRIFRHRRAAAALSGSVYDTMVLTVAEGAVPGPRRRRRGARRARR